MSYSVFVSWEPPLLTKNYFIAGQSNAGSMRRSDFFGVLTESTNFSLTDVIAGGTSLGPNPNKDDWHPVDDNDPTTGELLELLFAQIDAKIADPDQEIGGLIWVQGEADKNNQPWTDAYATNLELFIQAITDRYGSGFPIVIVALSEHAPIGQGSYSARWETIRAAQFATAAAHSNVHVVDPDVVIAEYGLDPNTVFRDEVHYTFDFADLLFREALTLIGDTDATELSDFLTGTGDDETIFAGQGNDTVEALNGRDFVDGGYGDDRIEGQGGADEIHGGAGNDTLYGGGGSDTLFGGDGEDRLSGGNGFDFIAGGAGDDEIYLNSGNDTATGEAGNDMIWAGGGHDLVFGGDGDDVLRGGGGGDTLLGDAGRDALIGNTGDDTLVGGAGDDLLTGGLGHDVFVFEPDGGFDIIGRLGADEFFSGDISLAVQDLQLTADRVDLSSFSTLSAGNVMSHISDTDQGALLVAEGTSILFVGVYVANLTSDIFDF